MVALLRNAGRTAGDDGADGRRLRDDEAQLVLFARSRTGVEGFVEVRVPVTDTTIVLVAATGEWTRRRVPGPQAAYQLGRRLGIAVHDVAVVGYPQRMRDWTSRLCAEQKVRRDG